MRPLFNNYEKLIQKLTYMENYILLPHLALYLQVFLCKNFHIKYILYTAFHVAINLKPLNSLIKIFLKRRSFPWSEQGAKTKIQVSGIFYRSPPGEPKGAC